MSTAVTQNILLSYLIQLPEKIIDLNTVENAGKSFQSGHHATRT